MHTSLFSCAAVTAFIDGIGGPEVMMVMFIALVLFGGKSLPSFARTVGKSLREFKKATGEVEKELRRAIEEEPEQPASHPYAPPLPLTSAPAAQSPGAPIAGSSTATQASPVPEYSPYPELASLHPAPAPESAPPTTPTTPASPSPTEPAKTAVPPTSGTGESKV